MLTTCKRCGHGYYTSSGGCCPECGKNNRIDRRSWWRRLLFPNALDYQGRKRPHIKAPRCGKE